MGSRNEGGFGVSDTYRRLIDLLDRHSATYRLLDHPPEGRTLAASRLRGHEPGAAAKCMVVAVRTPGHPPSFTLAVIPGTHRVNLPAVCRLTHGRRAALAPVPDAERLTGCATGCVIPFSLHAADLQLVVDPWLLEHEQVYFNAARLDRSVAIRTSDYLLAAHPRLAPVAALAA